MRARRTLLVPEVVQTSNMDCGPAALKCLLEGFGIRASYGRLREACQTDVDGTSIDSIEEAAKQLGLNAEQIVVPVDHVLLEEAECLPAIAVIVTTHGITHFVVIWRTHGGLVQLMDPAVGRRFSSRRALLNELYVHEMRVPAGDWREYAGSEQFLTPLRSRLRHLGLTAAASETALETALADSGWSGFATLDAAVRATGALVASGGIRVGREAETVLESFRAAPSTIPNHYWFVRACEDESLLVMRGAVLVRALGIAPEGDRVTPQSAELAASLHEESPRPAVHLLRLMRSDGWFAPASLASGLVIASAAVVFEAILLRALFDPNLATLQFGAIAAVAAFAAVLFLLEWPLSAGLLRMGRRLEIRLRMTFLRKMPRLSDRYFESRLKSDMAERAHSIQRIRRLPKLGGDFLRACFELALTTVGIIWLDPSVAALALGSAIASVAFPICAQPLLIERDLRVRTHAGALTRYYLDALLGLVAIFTHGAQPAVRRQHESLLVEWSNAALRLQRVVTSLEAVQYLTGFGLAVWLVSSHAMHHRGAGTIVLLVYWALNLPVLGQEIAAIAWQYPSYRNITLRLLEPLGAVESGSLAPVPADADEPGTSLTFDGVSVVAGGHVILSNIDLHIASGEHVAVVGHSGAGKSSLVGLLLGWHRAAQGRILIDGKPLDDSFRLQVAWLDPAVQIWNRSLSENLRYGVTDPRFDTDTLVDAADLAEVVSRLPQGADTLLGEGGGLLSGGEGQRVRFARALARPKVRLAILDEPFRGLDIERRRRLLAKARQLWRDTTFICITHDIRETLGFPRVLVVEDGHIAEDASPHDLAANPNSRFSALLRAEDQVREGLWSDTSWRHLRLEEGQIV